MQQTLILAAGDGAVHGHHEGAEDVVVVVPGDATVDVPVERGDLVVDNVFLVQVIVVEDPTHQAEPLEGSVQ